MIEVEKKFLLTPSQKETIIQKAEFLKEVKFTDTYYDTSDYKLTLQGVYLRKRNQKFQLKSPIGNQKENKLDQFREITNDQDIIKFLNLDITQDLESQLTENKFLPLCKFETTRSKYKKDIFVLDFDIVDYPEFQWHIGEIELMVDSESDIPTAVQKIIEYAKTLGLEIAPVRGKVLHYIKITNPSLYKKTTSSEVAHKLNSN